MTPRRPPLRQVLLAYALLGSVLAAAWYGAGQPVAQGLAQGQARVAALETRVRALKQAAARDPALQPQQAAARQTALQTFIDRHTVAAETLQVAGSLLQRRLATLIEEHGGRPGNTRVATEPATAAVRVSTRFTADLPDIAAVLDALTRAEQPSMFVDTVSVRRRDHYLDPAVPGSDGAPPHLAVQLDIAAFWRGAPAAE